MKMQKYICFRFIAALLFFSAFFLAPLKVEAQTPGEMVVATIDKGLQILKDPSFQAPEQYSQRRAKLWELLAPVFDFDEIGKRVLGSHWATITPQQQQDFSDIFSEILKDSYLGKTDSYSGEKIVFVRELIQGSRGKVQTQFFTVDGKKYIVDFSLLSNAGSWKIYDATVEGVGLVSTYRSQFNEVLAKSSFEELLQKLREKHNNFIQSKSQT